MRIGFTASAERQLLEALRAIATDRLSAAVRLLDRVSAALTRMRDFPESGRRVPEFPDSPYREIVLPPYRMFYRRDRDGLIVVALWHEAQLPDRPEDD